ncbi:MAG: hypothetical protein R3E79_51585 [Caldilineaceae bacterium]
MFIDIADNGKAQRIAIAGEALGRLARRQHMQRCMFNRMMLARTAQQFRNISNHGEFS